MISASTARRFWGEASPVDQRLHWGPPASSAPWIEIVGVVGEVRYREIEAVSLDVYVPFRQNNWPLRNLIVRAAGDPVALAPAIRAQLRELDPAIRASEIVTTRELVWKSMARPRFHTLLLGLFGALALVIGAVGIYGVLAHSVTTRRREIGVRLTLGATAEDILRGILGRGLRLAAIGVVLGLGIAWAVSRVLASVLFEISATDPATYLTTAVVLIGVSLLACGLPALRASRVDPLVVLRSE